MAWVFMAGKLVEQVKSKQIREFERRILPNSEVRTDVFNTLRVQGESYRYEPKTSLLGKVVEWLLNVHTVISNFKSILVGSFHGVSHQYLQEYIVDSVLRINRRFWNLIVRSITASRR